VFLSELHGYFFIFLKEVCPFDRILGAIAITGVIPVAARLLI
jgi:hypothetical protein